MPFVIRNDEVERYNLKARHPDWKRRDRITDCFNFMQTCRQVYEEALPIFWRSNRFLLQAEPEEGFTRFTRHPEAASQLKLSITSPRNVRVCVESPKSRQKIRRLVWNYGTDHDPVLRYSEDWKCYSYEWHSPEIGDLTNVTELTVILDEYATNLTRFPSPENAEGYVETMWTSDEPEEMKSTFLAFVKLASSASRAGTLEHLRLLTAESLPYICDIRLGGLVNAAYYDPTKFLADDGTFIQDVASALASWGKTCYSAGVQESPKYPIRNLLCDEIPKTWDYKVLVNMTLRDDRLRLNACHSEWPDSALSWPNIGSEQEEEGDGSEGEYEDHDEDKEIRWDSIEFHIYKSLLFGDLWF